MTYLDDQFVNVHDAPEILAKLKARNIVRLKGGRTYMVKRKKAGMLELVSLYLPKHETVVPATSEYVTHVRVLNRRKK
jgi:hypothetical protein